jgi:hypothetical protein
MRRFPYYVIGIVLVFYGWHHYREAQFAGDEAPAATAAPDPATLAVERSAGDPDYRCDGRVYCSQMHSCEEATWFLQHCPGMKMDGDGDGVPCEKQWCGR